MPDGVLRDPRRLLLPVRGGRRRDRLLHRGQRPGGHHDRRGDPRGRPERLRPQDARPDDLAEPDLQARHHPERRAVRLDEQSSGEGFAGNGNKLTRSTGAVTVLDAEAPGCGPGSSTGCTRCAGAGRNSARPATRRCRSSSRSSTTASGRRTYDQRGNRGRRGRSERAGPGRRPAAAPARSSRRAGPAGQPRPDRRILGPVRRGHRPTGRGPPRAGRPPRLSARSIGQAEVRPPRWWTPAVPGDDSGRRAAHGGLLRCRRTRRPRVSLPPRGLARAARQVPSDDQPRSPGTIAGGLVSTPIPVRRMEEVTAAGPMSSSHEQRRLRATSPGTRPVGTPTRRRRVRRGISPGAVTRHLRGPRAQVPSPSTAAQVLPRRCGDRWPGRTRRCGLRWPGPQPPNHRLAGNRLPVMPLSARRCRRPVSRPRPIGRLRWLVERRRPVARCRRPVRRPRCAVLWRSGGRGRSSSRRIARTEPFRLPDLSRGRARAGSAGSATPRPEPASGGFLARQGSRVADLTAAVARRFAAPAASAQAVALDADRLGRHRGHSPRSARRRRWSATSLG